MSDSKIFANPVRTVIKSALLRNSPAYVQYYITARCNLRCQQCNVIYANSDQVELDTLSSKKVIEKLAELGTSVVLLTGGEPFIRKDLPEIVEHCIKVGIHPRLQTNGLASKDQLQAVADAGANDISISLDTLKNTEQNLINGDFENSFELAIQTISRVNEIFPADSFASLGCVFSPTNYLEIPKVVKFATKIGWWISVVPAHTTQKHSPRAFSSFDNSLNFSKEQLPMAMEVIQELKTMKKNNFNVYDSEQYLDDIYRFISGQRLTWRDRNYGLCDSPDSYFAITPNGDMAVCCDYRLPSRHSLLSDEFTDNYKKGIIRDLALPVISNCSGCMYGSFPEITNSLRFAHAAFKRLSIFFNGERSKLVKLNYHEMLDLTKELDREN